MHLFFQSLLILLVVTHEVNSASSTLWERIRKGLFGNPSTPTPDTNPPQLHKNYLDDNGLYHSILEDHDDAGGSNENKVFVPENRPVKKTYSTVNEIIHPKKIERNETQIKVEFDEYNETTKSLVTQYMIGNISTEVLKANLSSFIFNDQVVITKRHRVEGPVANEVKVDPRPAIALPRVVGKPTGHPSLVATSNTHIAPDETTYTSADLHRDGHIYKEAHKHKDESEALPLEKTGGGKLTRPKHKPKPAATSTSTSIPVVDEHKTKYSTVDAVPHSSHDNYEKHIKEALKSLDSGKSKLVFIGDSCLSQMARDATVRDLLIRYHPINLASPGFRTEHMLYRLTTSNSIHKIFGIPFFVIMVGTFNIGIHDSPEATHAGIMAIIEVILKSALPTSRIIVCSILPRHSISLNKKIDKTNELVAATLHGLNRVHFLYLDNLFKGTPYPEKLLNDDFYMPDHLHPSESGYHTIVGLIKPFMKQYDEKDLLPKELNISKTIVETLL